MGVPRALQWVLEHLTFDRTLYCNPFRNQTDYIICKNIHRVLSQNSKYSGSSTPTDHKLVKAAIKIDWWNMKQHFKKMRKKLKSISWETQQLQRMAELKQKLLTQIHLEHITPSEAWKVVLITCKKTAKAILGINKGWHPYPKCHTKCQFNIKLYTQPPTSANVKCGNPQYYDYNSTLIPCQQYLTYP